jgi:hypothetical protein
VVNGIARRNSNVYFSVICYCAGVRQVAVSQMIPGRTVAIRRIARWPVRSRCVNVAMHGMRGANSAPYPENTFVNSLNLRARIHSV